jgi:hypothetical protein
LTVLFGKSSEMLEAAALRDFRDRNARLSGQQALPRRSQPEPTHIPHRGQIEEGVKVLVQGAFRHTALPDKIAYGKRPTDRLAHDRNRLFQVARDGRAERRLIGFGGDWQPPREAGLGLTQIQSHFAHGATAGFVAYPFFLSQLCRFWIMPAETGYRRVR